MEALEFSAEPAEPEPLHPERPADYTVQEMRRTQRQEFAKHVERELIPERGRLASPQSLRDILARPDYQGLSSAAVLETVRHAADHNELRESHFERRHEAKDLDIPDYGLGIEVPTATSASVYQRFIAPVLGPQPSRYQLPASSPAPKNRSGRGWRLPALSYRQAILGGILAAGLTLLAMAGLLLLK